MERPAPCPRVNFALMEKYIGQHVLLVCKVHFPPYLCNAKPEQALAFGHLYRFLYCPESLGHPL